MKRKISLTIALILCIGMLVNFMNTTSVHAVEITNSLEKQEFKYDLEDEIQNFDDLSKMNVALEKFILTNPNSIEEEQNQFLISFVENGGLRNDEITLYGIGDYTPGYNKLNPAERKLAKKYPLQAVKVYNTSKRAINLTIEYYGYNGFQDNSDAFRHCLWNALMKKDIGESAAESWATAHEYNSSGIDKRMDLYNNSVGRGINVSEKFDNSIATLVKFKVEYGACRRIVNNKIVKTNGDGLKK